MKDDAKQLVVNEGRTKKSKQCVKSLRLIFSYCRRASEFHYYHCYQRTDLTQKKNQKQSP